MSAQVLTITLNPALDQTVTLARLRLGEVHRPSESRIDAAGKGVNVASCLADWGVSACVTGLLGAGNTQAFDRLFAAKGIADSFVRRPGNARTNVKLLDIEAADTTDLNLPAGLPPKLCGSAAVLCSTPAVRRWRQHLQVPRCLTRSSRIAMNSKSGPDGRCRRRCRGHRCRSRRRSHPFRSQAPAEIDDQAGDQ